MLMSFLLSRNLNIVREVINNKLQLLIAKDPIVEANNSNNNIIFSRIGGDELESLNQTTIYPGFLKEDYDLFQKLETLTKKKS